ncbi:phosphatidylinositol 5-phosphate 4-kinase type-2 alpha-like [Octopus vulgaris]|uniref:Phosphatidylinositol 5-phosphate 4-kinase type-2 alpha-like n=2 Tax=Octopus TaxID=6643 RepID=A0AA36B706_OCTVU|nr:phosphatidylinositol 5-phosphate 4-kinase type-2 alpha isoform X2 [Octopus sinensis]UUA79793.1 phosphatidylinositol 5-phosphate 4-kinase type-2 beta [Octopus vulgaris]CAI9728724.1 phosphatidylinositol 5-phosphate 4-kinase type-2 alpha-like [Octopus vulgaris]
MASAKRKHLKMKTVQQKVKLFRANEPLLSVFMWGINHTINELSHIPVPVMLMPDDFKAFTKVRKDNHLYNKENMPSHFKVKEYCPMVFRNLRERFGVDDIDYMNSLTKQPVEMDSPGRSGARMLLSQDKKYFIKTLVSEEVEQMHHILKQYHSYIVERHAQTLLPQYLGMYRITVNDVETYLVVLRNVFSPRLTIHKKYDLKGSTVDRQASDKEKAKDLPTLKDNDFVNDGVIIHIGAAEKDIFMKKLNADTEFLAGLHLMDYSLIVGIHDCEKAEQEAFEAQLEAEAEAENGENADGEADDGLLEEEEINDVMGSVPTPPDSPQTFVGQPFTGEVDPKIEIFGIKSGKEDKQIIYFLAMIDILTKYGMKKRTAQAAKTVKHGSGAEISTVRPDQYAKRFLEFIERSIE